MMKMMCVAYFGLLLALHLSSQVIEAQNATVEPLNATVLPATMSSNTADANQTTPAGNGCRLQAASAFLTLIPVTLAASLLPNAS